MCSKDTHTHTKKKVIKRKKKLKCYIFSKYVKQTPQYVCGL